MTLQDVPLRAGTAAAWTALDPILPTGKPGLETDSGKFKYGDGVTPWSGLPYGPSPGGGSQPVSFVRVPINFNTASIIFPGKIVYTPTGAERILWGLSSFQIDTAWDGATPELVTGFGDPAGSFTGEGIMPLVAADYDLLGDGSVFGSRSQAAAWAGTAITYWPASAGAPLKAYIDDGAQGDPGSTVGAGVLILAIQAAP